MLLNEYIEQKLFHEVHTSERKAFKNCRRKWHWTFRDRYYPLITAKPLEFGTAFHKGMETYYNPSTWLQPRQVVAVEAILDFIEVCEKQKQQAIDNANDIALQPDQEKDYAERVELGKGMLSYYFKDVAPYIDHNFIPIAVEKSFAVPIKHPITGAEAIWCKCQICYDKWWGHWDAIEAEYDKQGIDNPMPPLWKGLPVAYEGRMDMLAIDHNMHYWVFDWKTTSRMMDRNTFLYLDDQVGSYVWAMDKIGLDIRGFVYHEQHKSYPQPPKRLKSIRQGRAFSVSKSEPVEYDSYLATVMTEDKDAYDMGFYDEHLAYLKNEGVKFWQRHQISKSPQELANIEYNIGLEVLDMLHKDLLIYPSSSKFGCDWCAFQTPCMEMNAGGDFQYALDTLYEKKDHYYVREELSTEIKG